MEIWITIGVTVVAIAGLSLAWNPLRQWLKKKETQRAVASFRLQRESLEAKFFELASRAGKPRGLRWLDIEWLDGVRFARDSETGLLTAFTAINLRFEAIEGGDMEDVEAVGMVREGSALFHFQGEKWGTGGRALFNMNPDDAISRLQGQYDPIA